MLYGAAADMGQVTESRPSMIFFSYKKSGLETDPTKEKTTSSLSIQK